MKREDVVWLVKSGGRILGPYSYLDLEDLLRKKELHVIDEVCQPMRRWCLIRDHLVFRDMIEKLRQEDASIDDGTTTFGGGTLSLTESVHGAHADDITEDISEFQGQLKEIVYENIAENQRIPPRPVASGRYQSSTQAEEKAREEVNKGSRWMWAFTAVVLLGVGGVWAAKRMPQRLTPIVDVSGGLSEGLGLFEDGDYPNALEVLKRAYNSDPAKKEIWFPLATMLIQIDGQTVEAKRLLQKVIEEKTNEPAAAWTAMALAQMVDGENSSALESLNKALSIDGQFLPAKVNLGSLSFLKKDYAASFQQLSQVYNGGMRRGEVLLQIVASLIYNSKSANAKNSEKNERESFQTVLKAVQNYLRSDADYSQEVRLSEVYLNYLRNELPQNEYETQIRRVIDVDPQQTDDFHHPILTAKVMSNWTHVGAWCRQVSDVGGELPSAIALGAICLYKQGQYLQAKSAIEKAINQAPRDPLLQGVYATILKVAGFGGEASVALGRAIELDRRSEYVLPMLLQARFCQEKEDYECANTYWMKVLQLDPRVPAAKMGLAEMNWAKGSKNEALRLMQDAGTQSPHYRPYFQLKRKMDIKE